MVQAAQIMIEKRAYFFKIIRNYLKFNRYEDIEDIYQELLLDAYNLKIEATKAYLAQRTAWYCIDWLKARRSGLPVTYYDNKRFDKFEQEDNLVKAAQKERKMLFIEAETAKMKPKMRALLTKRLTWHGDLTDMYKKMGVVYGTGHSLMTFAVNKLKVKAKEQYHE